MRPRCSGCGLEMVVQAAIASKGLILWQCPECKNVDLTEMEE